MSRVLRRLLIVVALLFGQHAAMVHAFEHARIDPKSGLPVAPHLSAKCLAFHAVDSVLPSGAACLESGRVDALQPGVVSLPASRAPRLAFKPRAPPRTS